MKPSLNDLKKRVAKIEDTIDPKPKQEIRFTMDESEIDETLENVIWVHFKL